LEVGTGFHPELTGRENIYLNGAILGMRKREIDRKLDEIIDFSGVERYIDTPVKRYSSGMYVRLAFAVAAHLESEILIVDEVLAVGDAEFQKKCLGKMGEVSKGEGRTVLFVSHNIAAVDKLCNTGIFLEDGKIASQGLVKSVLGNYKKTLQGNLFQKDSGFIREVLVNQKDDKIVIQGIFESEFDIKGPSLGFVVSEIDGTKLFGGNPYLNIKEGQEIPIMRSGRIECIIEEPKLLNGNYLLSVWFGDEKNDFESFEDVIQFEIINMTPVFTRYFNKNDTGSIYTKSQFNFYED
jgi:lipopolysaccharide transport system ATP-binding protein